MSLKTISIKRPIIILGAARSGTKILREVLASHPEIIPISFDINFIWKYGNFGISHDELKPNCLTSSIKEYIYYFFSKFQKKDLDGRVVEKTVSNTLRVPFVRAIFPNCQFIHLVRDGRDVAVSARRMWKAPMDWKNVLKKSRYFPLTGIPGYATKYICGYISRGLKHDDCLKSWGPRFIGIDEILQKYTLLEVCGIQWVKCMKSTLEGLKLIPSTDVLQIHYEEFVMSPLEVLTRIMKFLNMDFNSELVEYAKRFVISSNIGKWKKEIGKDELRKLMGHTESMLRLLNYQ